ncbi:MAG: tRNA uridine-5-carboxymethylaminomethyl(34) synthesis GTPase MnmE [Alphaproteobacteria bacterium HGW-Alphaproteobacteria-2]|nr:MAG: tRNA uridine-5-carboxymethylaminomethyl(34) synthesis GTPase MnmE [Alphaproteobacteria bacterium HGW-Alphaproteobacteria-2]
MHGSRSENDTIYALATPRARSGVAIVRISGPRAGEVGALFGFPAPVPRKLQLRRLRESQGEILDEALVVLFREGESFTGEAMAELHLHGSLAVIGGVLEVLGRAAGFRAAEPGEFTRRALELGRIGLTEVEGLADLIDAETRAQRIQAMRLLGGALGVEAEAWRSRLVEAAALIEAALEFGEDGVEPDWAPVRDALEGVVAWCDGLLKGAPAAERLRQGFEVAIVGWPNAGKSTLMNRIVGRSVSLVTEVPGTTRDVLEARLDLDGIPVTLLDLAGIRDSEDPVERLGVAQAIARAEAADLRVFLAVESGLPEDVARQEGDIVVRGKADLLEREVRAVSGLTGTGVDDLVAEIAARLRPRVAGASLLTRERHVRAVDRARSALQSAAAAMDEGESRLEFAASDMRSGVIALEGLIGRVDVEDLLDDIFSRFCLGK